MKNRLITTLCIGEEAESLRKAAVPLMESYSERCNADFRVLGSKGCTTDSDAYYQKFQVRDLLDQYQRVLYIDMDVLISPLSVDLFKIVPPNAFGATGVESVLRSASNEKSIMQQCFGDVGWTAPYFNAGVMLFSQSTKPMLDFSIENKDRWIEFVRENNVKTFNDQSLLNYAFNFNGPSFFDLGESFNFTRAWNQFENVSRRILCTMRDWPATEIGKCTETIKFIALNILFGCIEISLL